MDNLNGEEIKPRKKTHKFLKGLIVIVFALVTYFAAFYLGNNLATKGIVIGGAVPKKAVADLEEIGDSGKYSNLFNLRSMLFSMYDGEIDDEKLLEGAMKGMANAVGDPYTVYMDKEEFNKFTEQDAYLIFVTNEIGLGGVSPDAVQRRFTDLQGWLNQYIASRADEVVFMVSGIPMKVK